MRTVAPRRSVVRIFFMPTIIAVISVVGLLTALLGDGIWDVISWLTLALAPAVLGVSLFRHMEARENWIRNR